MKRNFFKLLSAKWTEGKFICVGLDSDYEKIPEHIKEGRTVREAIFEFNKRIIDKTKDLVCAYKLNSAFYEAHGAEGFEALKDTIAYINKVASTVPTIWDAKRGDIGNTNNGYTKAGDFLGADAITVAPYMGSEAMKPFLDQKDKGVIVLCRTSNPGAGEFQDLQVMVTQTHAKYMYEIVAETVCKKWNYNGNCLLVVGATYPNELKVIRDTVGDMGLLIPGVGKQGGTIGDVISNGLDSTDTGIIINSSREVIFASDGKDFAEKARAKVIEMNQEVEQCLAY